MDRLERKLQDGSGASVRVRVNRGSGMTRLMRPLGGQLSTNEIATRREAQPLPVAGAQRPQITYGPRERTSAAASYAERCDHLGHIGAFADERGLHLGDESGGGARDGALRVGEDLRGTFGEGTGAGFRGSEAGNGSTPRWLTT